jgi:exopolysaccharide biosynthesis predicted pyruvyltransferase EpsI
MMTRDEKRFQLRRCIETRLRGLFDRDYVLLGLPYYLNIGDILIWEGQRQFFTTLRCRCLNEGYHYRDYRTIPDGTLIVLQGGGNFGDLWRFIQDERLSIVQHYGNCPIVVTPVTCWYENSELLRQDAEMLSKHPNLTICARDAVSFDLLRKHFRNRIVLVPDMAFYIEPKKLRREVRGRAEGVLFLKRSDKELASDAPLPPKEVLARADVHDWPSMERDPACWIRYQKLYRLGQATVRCGGLSRIGVVVLKSSDWYYHSHCRKQLIREGVRFVGRYRDIYTTRLHGGILSILLDKEVTIIDNSYGKNASYFETWLSDTEGVELLRPQ